MGFEFVGASNGMFHSPFRATVVVFGVSDVGPVLGAVCVITTRREDCVFRIEGVVSFGV
jgi:hypothetical protein